MGTNVFIDLSFIVRKLYETANVSCCAEQWGALAWSVRTAAVHRAVAGWYLPSYTQLHSCLDRTYEFPNFRFLTTSTAIDIVLAQSNKPPAKKRTAVR